MKCFRLRIRNLPSHKKPERELLSKYVSTLPTFTILLLVKIKDLDFSCWNLSLRLTAPQSLGFPQNPTFCQQNVPCFSGLFFFNSFYLGKYFFRPPPCLPSPPSRGAAPKGACSQDSETLLFALLCQPCWCHGLGFGNGGRDRSQLAPPQQHFPSWSLAYTTPKRHSPLLCSPRKVATLCGKIKLLDNVPFTFTMAHSGNSIQYFLPATCNRGSQTACFVSGFWVWVEMKGRFISLIITFFVCKITKPKQQQQSPNSMSQQQHNEGKTQERNNPGDRRVSPHGHSLLCKSPRNNSCWEASSEG